MYSQRIDIHTASSPARYGAVRGVMISAYNVEGLHTKHSYHKSRKRSMVRMFKRYIKFFTLATVAALQDYLIIRHLR